VGDPSRSAAPHSPCHPRAFPRTECHWTADSSHPDANQELITVTAFGAFGILAAGFNGGSFLNYNDDFSSMLMASFSAIAVVAYAAGLYVTAQPESA
jgi:hypothetical protein